MKSRYLSPTSSDILNADVVGSTSQHLKLGVWYEQDFEIDFYPEKDGLKTQGLRAISEIRIVKR